jgi:hypothetical protein
MWPLTVRPLHLPGPLITLKGLLSFILRSRTPFWESRTRGGQARSGNQSDARMASIGATQRTLS